ncbi:MAG: glycosyltransferase [Blastocatellia bacterium]
MSQGGTKTRKDQEEPTSRVLQVIDRLNVGGPARVVFWLAEGLEQRGFATQVICGQPAHGEEEMDWVGTTPAQRVHRLPEMGREISWRDLGVTWKLLQIFRACKPDVVQTHKAKAGAVGRVAAWLYNHLFGGRCRVIHLFHGHVLHGYYGPWRSALFLAIERVLAAMATDRIITLSRLQQEEILGRYRIGKPSQHVIVELGIDEEPAIPGALRGLLGKGSERDLIGWVGRLTEIKEPELLVRAARTLAETLPSAHFVMLGDGHLRVPLESLVQELLLAPRFTFLGSRADIRALYGDLALLVLTSRNEGTPLVLLEAMAAGVPVVATAVGGVPDLMGERVEERGPLTVWSHGVTIPAGDATALASAVALLLSQPALRQQMGYRAREWVRHHRSKERMVEQLAKIYQPRTSREKGKA